MYYKLEGCVVRAEDGAVIPMDVGNKDYITFLEWCSSGNTPGLSKQNELDRIREVGVHHKYLASTDWYISRLVETGVEVPQEVLDGRAAARDAIP